MSTQREDAVNRIAMIIMEGMPNIMEAMYKVDFEDIAERITDEIESGEIKIAGVA